MNGINEIYWMLAAFVASAVFGAVAVVAIIRAAIDVDLVSKGALSRKQSKEVAKSTTPPSMALVEDLQKRLGVEGAVEFLKDLKLL